MQPSAFESEVELADAIVSEALSGSNGSQVVIRLHEDGTESVGAPIGFQKCWLVAIVACEAWARGDASFHFVKEQA